MNEFFVHSALKPWKQLATKVGNAVIFLDNHCSECLHWCGGADLLFDAGAASIKEFSSFESGEKDKEKGVFIVSSPICGTTSATIQDIVRSSHFTSCLIVTTLESQVHQYASGDEGVKNDNFLIKLESDINKCMRKSNTIVEIIHLPLFIAPMFDNFFVTPSFDEFYPVQQKDLKDFELQGGEVPETLSDLHFYMLPHEYQTLLRMIASSFRQCFHALGCKEEIFAIGPTSHLLSVQLSHLLNLEKTVYSNRCGVLFIDRTVDLIGPCSHSGQSLVDQLLSILPGLPAHFNNISVDMSSLCTAMLEDEDNDDAIVYPGCLVADTKENKLLSEIYKLTSQEAISDIQARLLKAASEESLDVDFDIKKKGSTAECIENIVQHFKEDAGAVLYNSSLLQLGLATAQMLQDPSYKKLKIFATAEKLMLQQLGDGNPSGIIDQLVVLLESQEEDLVTFEDVCSLLIYSSYVFKDKVDNASIKKLAKCISGLLQKTTFGELPENFLSCFSLTEDTFADVDVLSQVVKSILVDLLHVKINELSYFKILHFGTVEPPSYHPALPQIVGRIFDRDKPELEPDIEHITTGRKDLLKMGLSMFRKITPPRPCDFPLLVIYVVGGITAAEVAQINRVLENHTSHQCKVVIGSNRLISPSDCADKTFFEKIIT